MGDRTTGPEQAEDPLEHYLSIGTMFRDDAAWLREWIEFHRIVGVDHFFLYDHESGDSPRTVLGDYIDRGIVTVTDWTIPYRERAETRAFQHCLEEFGPRSRWLAFVDVDEFLFAPRDDRVSDALAAYEAYPGVVVNWQTYGSSGHEATPEGLVIENFTRRAATRWVRNRRMKSIVDPARALRTLGAHFFEYADGALAVTENEEPVRITGSSNAKRILGHLAMNITARIPWDPYAHHRDSRNRISVDRLRINHYVVKSRAHYAEKARRFQASGLSYYQEAFFAYHDRNEVDDPILARYGPRVRRALEE